MEKQPSIPSSIDLSTLMGIGLLLALTLYITFGVVAVLTGLLNPVGFIITVMSAMASRLGGMQACSLSPTRSPKADRTGHSYWIAAYR